MYWERSPDSALETCYKKADKIHKICGDNTESKTLE